MRGNVIYLSTFSKTLAPGLRLAWIVAPVEVIQRCAVAKQGMDLHTATLNQMIAQELLTSGADETEFLKGHVRLIREVYRERRDVMLTAMQRHFPAEVSWTQPDGGLFLWVTLPDYLDAAELLKEALAMKVAFVPGNCFDPDELSTQSLRLNFSFCTPEKINVGIRRLGDVFGRAIERHAAGQADEVPPVLHAAF
jgi:2-aminoadipate transaminase